MDSPLTPQFYLNFLLRSKAYLKEHSPSTSIANTDFPLSSKPEDKSRLILHTLQGLKQLCCSLLQYKVLRPQCHTLSTVLCTF